MCTSVHQQHSVKCKYSFRSNWPYSPTTKANGTNPSLFPGEVRTAIAGMGHVSVTTLMWWRDNGALHRTVDAWPPLLLLEAQGASASVKPTEAADVGAAVPQHPLSCPAAVCRASSVYRTLGQMAGGKGRAEQRMRAVRGANAAFIGMYDMFTSVDWSPWMCPLMMMSCIPLDC